MSLPSSAPLASHAPAQREHAETTFPEDVWRALSVFRSLQLAIVLIGLLGVGVLVGVLIPQDGLVQTFELKAQYGTWYRPMAAAGLFNVYSTPWFIAIEVLFFFNLLFGSFQWLRPASRAAIQRTFCGPEHALASPNKAIITTTTSPDVVQAVLSSVLKKRGYRIHWNETKAYAHQWSVSRLGPVVAHLGILLVLVASVYGAFTGFKGQQMMAPGDVKSFTALDSFTQSMASPWWQGHKPNWTMVLHDFNIEYYAAHPTTPKQYISDLEIQTPEGKTLSRQDVSVNTPLSVDGVMFYQANFAPTGKFFMSINGKPLVAEVNTKVDNRPISMLPIGGPETRQMLVIFPFFVQRDEGVTRNHIQVFLYEGQSVADIEASKTVPPNVTLFEGQSGTLEGNQGEINVTFDHPEIATGFQIKHAPETALMYLAFGLIMLGTVLCFFSQRQVWASVVPSDPRFLGKTGVYLCYKTNKAKWSFRKDRVALEQALVEQLEGTLDVGTQPPNEETAA